MSDTFFKLVTTYVTEGAGLLSEYWVIGLLHEIGRHTIYFNDNVNSPRVGYFITAMFSLFYLGRICGNLFGLGFAQKRKHTLFTYFTFLPLLVATYFQSLYTGALWILGSRVIIGFLSGFSPVMCMLRAECRKTQLMSQLLKAQRDKGGLPEGEGNVKIRLKRSAVAPVLPATIEFCCAYGVIGLASLLYNSESLDITRPTFFFTLILLVMFIIFVIAFKCREQPVS